MSETLTTFSMKMTPEIKTDFKNIAFAKRMTMSQYALYLIIKDKEEIASANKE